LAETIKAIRDGLEEVLHLCKFEVESYGTFKNQKGIACCFNQSNNFMKAKPNQAIVPMRHQCGKNTEAIELTLTRQPKLPGVSI